MRGERILVSFAHFKNVMKASVRHMVQNTMVPKLRYLPPQLSSGKVPSMQVAMVYHGTTQHFDGMFSQ